MNKQVIFIIVALLGGLGLIGVFALQLIRPDASATLINFVFQLLMLLGGFGGLAAMQAKQNQEIETIKTNTNGTLSRKDEDIADLRAALALHAPDALRALDASSSTLTRAQLRDERENGA